jgi:thioredoxin-related protein
MKKLLTVLVAVFALSSAIAAEGWMTDLPAAKAKAKAEGKLVLINFTGSDWCPWCFKIRDEIFASQEFKKYAPDNLVLVEIDFPRKTEQSAELKKTNKALAQEYKIEGYPTIVVLNKDGKRVDSLGYAKGGGQPFVEKLQAIKAKQR